MSIKAVLFDFGGVFTISPFGAVSELARERSCDPDQFLEWVFGPYHEDTTHPWHRLERGELSLDETRDQILEQSREAGHELDLWDVFIKIGQANDKVVHEPMVELLHELKKDDYTTAIVTNNIRELHGWQDLLPGEAVDLIVDSSFIGVRKPDAGIYNVTLERLGQHLDRSVNPEECVFLDDVESNCNAAKSVGMSAIHVTPDPHKTIEDLWQLLKS